MPNGETGGAGLAQPPPAAGRSGVVLAPELGGDLPCARCRYNLRGLSIRGVCPECGTPIRATILTRVDPLASELRPIFFPRLTAFGLLVWGVTPVLAAMLVWSLRLLGPEWFSLGLLTPEHMIVTLCILSGLAAGVLISPHAGPQARRGGWAAGLGVAAYVPLCWMLWRIHVEIDGEGGTAYGDRALQDPSRLLARFIATGAIIAALFLLRPNARLLAARSMLMRAGSIDRQTMRALASVLVVAMAGDGLRWLGWTNNGAAGELFEQAGQALVLIGSILFTIGLFGLAFDCWRLFQVLNEPPLSLGQILGPPPGPDPPRAIGGVGGVADVGDVGDVGGPGLSGSAAP
ncbi:hypothetical protein PHYC_00226 [Phycisphaerales bacterium]|nr:hypothetical protein PHYC_00226 [Phycisphaerales bacterium]